MLKMMQPTYLGMLQLGKARLTELRCKGSRIVGSKATGECLVRRLGRHAGAPIPGADTMYTYKPSLVSRGGGEGTTSRTEALFTGL